MSLAASDRQNVRRKIVADGRFTRIRPLLLVAKLVSPDQKAFQAGKLIVREHTAGARLHRMGG